MHVTERLQDDILVLMISGRLSFYSRKVFQAVIKNAQTTGANHIIVNLEGVTYMDSAALSLLALAYLNLMAKNVVMSLVGPPKPIREMLDQANFPKLIPTYASEEIALQSTPTGV